MKTLANVIQSESCHWYFKDGRPCYEVKAKSKEGMRPATLRDARELNLLPSVTTILKVLDKYALDRWKIEQAVLACLTTPRKDGEELDQFVNRVMKVEEVQNQEARQAADIGTDIHAAIEMACLGLDWDRKWEPYVVPVLKELDKLGTYLDAEKNVTNNVLGYAGKLDWVGFNKQWLTITDFKTCNTIPEKESWPEHKLQLSGYGRGWIETNAISHNTDKPEYKMYGSAYASNVRTANIYISKKEPGKIATFIHIDWQDTFSNGFLPLVKYWQWANNYKP